MNAAIIERYRCPESLLESRLAGRLSQEKGYFYLGRDVLCYGQLTSHTPARSPQDPLVDLMNQITEDGLPLSLPFDPTEVIDNLRLERYAASSHDGMLDTKPGSRISELYYLLRPLLPPWLRRQVQRIYLRRWDSIAFPRWPVDLTVEDLLEKLLLLFMKAAGVNSIPFIWYWPEGASSAAIVTHDVETSSGRDYCASLMDLNESAGIRSSFQIVPEDRYTISPSLLQEIRSRGHVVNVQDLNHDGRLFRNREQFATRVQSINRYGRKFRALGFRSAVLYRNPDWFDQLEFEYDMSVPNSGCLEAQRGGCCTVFPYFIGDLLEIPVTTTQDYSLFHVLRDYSVRIWKAQLTAISERHGLSSFIIHPDYLSQERARDTYRALLDLLNEHRSAHGMWIATADEVNRWWRERSRMTLTLEGGVWTLQGQGSERARIAFASANDGKIVTSLQQPSTVID
jgi:hypothetical protein